jgi:hypothetical protein
MEKIIERNKRKSKCRSCRQMIDGKYRVGYRNNNNTYHLSCFWKYINRQLDAYAKMKKEYTGTIKKHMILEKL